MKNNDIEKRIIASLEDKSPLNSDVLEKARQEMRENSKKTKYNSYLKYIAVAGVLTLICLAIVLPIVFQPSLAKKCEYIEYSSMKEYFSQNDIDLKTYEEIINKGNNNPDQGFTPDSEDSMYNKTKCELIKYGNKDFCIAEHYTYIYGSKIENYVILIDNEKLEKELFSQFESVSKEIVIDGLNVKYSYDNDLKIGRSTFNYNGYKFYTCYYVENEYNMITHLKKFINFQKI